ncbi:MAG: LacI family DNA-binding transcriptional regulator [Ginsengibacter sp.]
MNKINMRQLAKELKVSVSTVSKALNDSHEISEQTKRKVLEGASRLNYTVNPYASSLRNKKSKTIAVILPEVADHFFSLAINGIQSVAEQNGYHVLIYLSHEKFSNEMDIIEDCKSGRVDGVLISVTSETSSADHFFKLRRENIPIVFFDREFEGFPSSKVITNDFDCGNMAASHLLKNGCRKIAFLSISSCLGICRKRAAGFKAAATELKMRTHSEVVILDAENNQELQDKIRKLLCSKNRPDGIVASVERIATAVYLVCLELGIAIPGQLKLVAFSAIETASILNPSLTTISQPAFEIGRTAAELLFKQMKKKSTDSDEETITIPSTLIERSSSSALA